MQNETERKIGFIEKCMTSFRNVVWVLAVIWQTAPSQSVWLLTAILLRVLLTPTELLLMRQLVDLIYNWLQNNPAGMAFDWTNVLILLFAVAVVALLRSASGHTVEYLSIMLREKIARRLGESVTSKCMRVSYAKLEDPSFNNLQDRARRAAQSRVGAVIENVIGLCSMVGQCISLGILTAIIHPLLPIVLIVLAPLLLLTYLKGSKNIWHLYRGQSESVRRVNYLTELLIARSNAHELRFFDLGNHFSGIWHKYTSDIRKQQLAMIRRNEAWRSISSLSLAVFTVLSLWLLLLKMSSRAYTLGDYTMLANTLVQLAGQYESALQSCSRLHENLLICVDLRDYLAIEEEKAIEVNGQTISFPLKKGIRFEHVSFRYPGTKTDVLKDINLTVAPDETIAIVGPNGAGKTTLVKMLLGLYPPSEGCVLYDDVELETSNRQSVWQASAALFQDFIHYELPIRQNIGFGCLENIDNDHELITAAKLGGVASLIEQLPLGLDTKVGKAFGGIDLSGGEWQKIALSRVLFRRAELIILDEPTSALDPLAEAELYQQFTAITHQRTVLLVSHRLGSARLADRIIVMQGGRIVEAGNHNQLMSYNGKYAAMYNSQASWYSEKGSVANG